MLVVATAGHVDHGKSALVRALTGMEPDRFAEEKARGMTIDLGYAWTDLADGSQVAFVDVPGHQRFIANMLAGLGPVPVVLLMVAADAGWSRQTEEHLAALDALGVRHGALVITRADLGDADLAILEAQDHLAGSTLQGCPAIATSAVTGQGLDEVRAVLSDLAATVLKPPPGPARLWIDRVFSIRGAGTVVTGTLARGSISVGDVLRVSPRGAEVVVRGLESLKDTVVSASAVARVAVNLRGIHGDALSRGMALVQPGGWTEAAIVDVRLTAEPAELPAEAILHIGSAAVPARVRPLGADTARLTLQRALPLHVGERALLRDPGRQRVAAGVVLLDVRPPRLHRRGAAAHRAAELAALTDQPDPVTEIRRRGAVRRADLSADGVLPPGQRLPSGTREVGNWVISDAQWTGWTDALITAVDRWAALHPTNPALPRATAARDLELPDADLLNLLVAARPELHAASEGVRRVDAQITFAPPIAAALDAVQAALAADPFRAPEMADLQAAGLDEKTLAGAVRAGLLIRIAAGVYLGPDALAAAVQRLAGLPQPFTVSDARQALATTRRVALPLLEQLDRKGLTRRVDADHRSVRPPRN